MNEPLKKKPASRMHAPIQRREGASVHDDSGHLWAVSYCDFLMVLLCFFIIFFSIEPDKKDSLIQKIFMINGEAVGPGAGNVPGTPADSSSPADEKGERSIASSGGFPKSAIEASLQNFSLSKSEDTEGLIVQFQDDLYESGSYNISGNRVQTLQSFLKKVLPYRDQVSLTFIGHADGSVLKTSKKKLFRDNFDLSAIRATRALQFAVQAGFPEDQVSAKGNSKNSRVSRTLSVLIRPRGDFL